jgi:hypothetical protein
MENVTIVGDWCAESDEEFLESIDGDPADSRERAIQFIEKEIDTPRE